MEGIHNHVVFWREGGPLQPSFRFAFKSSKARNALTSSGGKVGIASAKSVRTRPFHLRPWRSLPSINTLRPLPLSSLTKLSQVSSSDRFSLSLVFSIQARWRTQRRRPESGAP